MSWWESVPATTPNEAPPTEWVDGDPVRPAQYALVVGLLVGATATLFVLTTLAVFGWPGVTLLETTPSWEFDLLMFAFVVAELGFLSLFPTRYHRRAVGDLTDRTPAPNPGSSQPPGRLDCDTSAGTRPDRGRTSARGIRALPAHPRASGPPGPFLVSPLRRRARRADGWLRHLIGELVG